MNAASRLFPCCALLLLLAARGSAQIVLPGLPGDYNLDGDVNEEDLDVWVNEFGGIGIAADGNLDGVTDIDDLFLWKDYEGASIFPPLARASVAATEVIYDSTTGELCVRPNGFPIFAFKISTFGSNVLSVANDDLPGAGVWDVKKLFSDTSVQGFDSSILNDVSPVTGDFPLDQLGDGVAKIAVLKPGLGPSDFASLSFGNTVGTSAQSYLTIVGDVPEPFGCSLALGFLYAAACVARPRRIG